MSFVNCHTETGVVSGLAWLVVEVDEVDAAEVDVDRGLMFIELRLMNDDVRVVDRVKVVFVADLVDFDAVETEDFVGSCFLLTPKNDSSCSRSCRAPDDSRSEARSSFRAVPFVVSLAAVGICRLKCGDKAGCDGSIGCGCGCEAFTGLGVGCFFVGDGLLRAIDMMLLLLDGFSLEIVVVVVPFVEGLTISNSSDFQILWVG